MEVRRLLTTLSLRSGMTIPIQIIMDIILCTKSISKTANLIEVIALLAGNLHRLNGD